MSMTIEQQIEEALDKVRPFIIRDGGNVEFDSFIDGIVYLRMFRSDSHGRSPWGARG